MEIVRDMDQLKRYISDAVVVSGDSPVLLDSYLSGAVECDVDALCDGENVHVSGIMQHILLSKIILSLSLPIFLGLSFFIVCSAAFFPSSDGLEISSK